MKLWLKLINEFIFRNQIVKLIKLLECTMMGIKLHGKILFKMLWMLRMQMMEKKKKNLNLLQIS